MNIGLLHPGQMGVTVGLALLQNQHQVLWLPDQRSAATTNRAQQAGFTPVESMSTLIQDSDALISVCPPAAAQQLAEQVAAVGFSGLYVDANAVAPQTATQIGKAYAHRFVDGGIIGPPAVKPGTTRLYLSGAQAAEVASWFSQGALQAVAMDAPIGAASALKMSYAGHTKGLSALLIATQALAEHYNVSDWLAAEWQHSQPSTSAQLERSAQGSAPKAWRFAGEMREIAASYDQAGLPSGFHLAAAQLYEGLAPLKDQTKVSVTQVVATLLSSFEQQAAAVKQSSAASTEQPSK